MLRPPRKPTPAPARRRDKRFLVSIPMLLHVGRALEEAVTVDVGHGGVFLSTAAEVPLQQLVRVELLLPPEGVLFTATGKPVHRVDEGSRDRTPGVGIQFYGLGREARATWDAFIAHVRASSPEAEVGPANLCHAAVVEPTHRRNPAHVKTLRVVSERLTDLVALERRASDEGRIFVLTDTQLYVDDAIGLQMVHPHTEDIFELDAKVVRCVRDGDLHGVEARLAGFDPDRARRFEEFVFDAIAPFFDDDDLTEG